MARIPGVFAVVHSINGDKIACRDWDPDIGGNNWTALDDWSVAFQMYVCIGADEFDRLHEDSIYNLRTLCDGLGALCSETINHFDYAAWYGRFEMNIIPTPQNAFLIRMSIDRYFEDELFAMEVTRRHLNEFRQGLLNRLDVSGIAGGV